MKLFFLAVYIVASLFQDATVGGISLGGLLIIGGTSDGDASAKGTCSHLQDLEHLGELVPLKWFEKKIFILPTIDQKLAIGSVDSATIEFFTMTVNNLTSTYTLCRGPNVTKLYITFEEVRTGVLRSYDRDSVGNVRNYYCDAGCVLTSLCFDPTSEEGSATFYFTIECSEEHVPANIIQNCKEKVTKPEIKWTDLNPKSNCG